MARQKGTDHSIDAVCYALGRDGYWEYSPGKIITEIAKELGIEK